MSRRARRQDQLVFAPLGVVDLGQVGRGGSGSHYLGVDGREYIGKCVARQNGGWVCFNEFLAGRLAMRLGLPIPEFRIVQFQGPLPAPALWFCSRRIKPGANPTAESFTRLVNAEQLGGIAVFDVWLCNTDRSRENTWAEAVDADRERVWMIDHGHTLPTSATLEHLPALGVDRILRYQDLVDGVLNVNALGAALEAVENLPDGDIVDYVHMRPTHGCPMPPRWTPRGLLDAAEEGPEGYHRPQPAPIPTGAQGVTMSTQQQRLAYSVVRYHYGCATRRSN